METEEIEGILEQEIWDNMPGQVLLRTAKKDRVTQVGLCGWSWCPRLCVRSQYCPLGKARARWLFGGQRAQRLHRRLVARQAIEENINWAAGSFRAFQLRLAWERRQRAALFAWERKQIKGGNLNAA